MSNLSLEEPHESFARPQTWTPSCWSRNGSDTSSANETPDECDQAILEVYNESLKCVANSANLEQPQPLQYRLSGDWETATKKEKQECKERATEACKLICNVIAPSDGQKLFQAINIAKSEPSKETIALITAFNNAPTRNLKTQILSIYAYEHSIKSLQELHEPFGKLTKWQIKRARLHARTNGSGVAVVKPLRHRVSLDMTKVDHFIDFVNRPYFHQDVAYGVRTLKLESGEKIQMPNVIRTVTRSTMVSQYFQFCKQEQYQPLSRSTLFRILEVREASQRKSLQGLDNTATDGSMAFETLTSIAEQLTTVGVNKTCIQSIVKRLEKAKQYLKTSYKANCQATESHCADHCRPFALSDPDSKDFQIKCTHQHLLICESCDELKTTLDELEKTINEHSDSSFTQDHRETLLHDFKEAQDYILRWKAHIVRSVNQELAKQDALENMDDSSALIVMDWAMKYLQVRYREKQSDWYGKRGMSWHVSSVVKKEAGSETVNVTSYVHLFDPCSQDWFAVASIIEDLLGKIKSDIPSVKNVRLRSDEAGCYHNNELIAALRDIGDRVGISVQSYDFSEPQQGKDICDRIICPLKSCIRRYCDEGNDVLSAKDMQAALTKRPVKGTTSSVNRLNGEVKHLEVKKLQNFSSFHNFCYTEDGVTIWKAYGVGKGKYIPNKKIFITHQEATQLNVSEMFPPVSIPSRPQVISKDDKESDNEEASGLFDCPELNCNYVFESIEELELHIGLGQHSRFINNENVYDTLRREWALRYATVSTNTSSAPSMESPLQQGDNTLKMGWALAKQLRGKVRFSPIVRQYLVAKFDYGERTGQKYDAVQVALDMRCARNECGEMLFRKDDWLNKNQISRFFSRLAKKRRNGKLSSGDNSSTADSQEEEMDGEDNGEEEEERRNLRSHLIREINVTHPIFYDSYDLCALHRGKKLSVFKVVMLKEICHHFELTVTTRDRKDDLLAKIRKMIQNCTCSAE